MRVLLQRVSRASVTIDGVEAAATGKGYLLLVGITHADDDATVDWMVARVMSLRILADAEGKMNLSITDTGGELLVVSQFTLYADASGGRRPGFTAAAPPNIALPLYDKFVSRLRAAGGSVKTGVFGAMMQVELVNDGPVTLLLER